MKKSLAVILSIMIILCGCFCGAVGVCADDIPLESISLNYTSITIKVGETVTLTPTYNPTDATEKGVTWKSSRSSVAAVSASGVVTAKKIGAAVITVKSNYNPATDAPSGTGGGGSSLPIIPLGGISATCRVTVVCAVHSGTTRTVRENEVEPTETKEGGYDTVVYCNDCGGEISRVHTVIPATGGGEKAGDLDGDDSVTDADAVYLLMHTFFPEQYPVSQDCDFDKDSSVTDADAVYLLMYTFFPEQYPIS